jgi:hypothetical protein
MEIIQTIAVVVVVAVAVYVLYKVLALIKLSDKAKEERNDEAPYKVEPADTAPDLAVSDKPKRVIITPAEVRIAKRLGLTLEQYAQELIKINEKEASKPKRSYTKRSKYWTDKRKKAVAAKARKTKPK